MLSHGPLQTADAHIGDKVVRNLPSQIFGAPEHSFGQVPPFAIARCCPEPSAGHALRPAFSAAPD